MFSEEFTIGRRSLRPEAQSVEVGRSAFCGGAELTFPLSAARPGARPMCNEAGQDQNLIRRGGKIGGPGFDCDAAVTDLGTGDQSLVGTDGASSATQTASASSVSPAQPERHYGVLPPASDDTAPGSAIAADTGAAKATFGASPGQNVPQLRSNGGQAALATPAGITHAAKAEIGGHRHAGGRKHSARLSNPAVTSSPPPAISGPERAWHWIVQSATGILAALSPRPSRQDPGLKTRWRADLGLNHKPATGAVAFSLIGRKLKSRRRSADRRISTGPAKA